MVVAAVLVDVGDGHVADRAEPVAQVLLTADDVPLWFEVLYGISMSLNVVSSSSELPEFEVLVDTWDFLVALVVPLPVLVLKLFENEFAEATAHLGIQHGWCEFFILGKENLGGQPLEPLSDQRYEDNQLSLGEQLFFKLIVLDVGAVERRVLDQMVILDLKC